MFLNIYIYIVKYCHNIGKTRLITMKIFFIFGVLLSKLNNEVINFLNTYTILYSHSINEQVPASIFANSCVDNYDIYRDCPVPESLRCVNYTADYCPIMCTMEIHPVCAMQRSECSGRFWRKRFSNCCEVLITNLCHKGKYCDYIIYLVNLIFV